MDQNTMIKYILWLFACKRFCRLLEIADNGFKHWVVIFNNNSGIESLPLNGGICSLHRKALGSGKLFKPSDKQTVSLRFSAITGITDIQQHIGIFSKELFYDGYQRVFNEGIIARVSILTLTKTELISIATTKWNIFKETNAISCARICSKIKVAIVKSNLVWRLPVDIFKRNLYHVTANFCWSSLAQRSATLRSHSCLISNECFHRCKASSRVIFLISIMVILLSSAAKVSIFFE